jgi:hypothetical protein
MFNPLKSFLARYIEKHYDIWGTKIECNLPPEFIITDHAYESMSARFNCRRDKMHKVMVKAWRSDDKPDRAFIMEAEKKHPRSIYKVFNGFVFVFRLRYNKVLGFSQKYLITTYKRTGYQFYDEF